MKTSRKVCRRSTRQRRWSARFVHRFCLVLSAGRASIVASTACATTWSIQRGEQRIRPSSVWSDRFTPTASAHRAYQWPVMTCRSRVSCHAPFIPTKGITIMRAPWWLSPGANLWITTWLWRERRSVSYSREILKLRLHNNRALYALIEGQHGQFHH